MIVIRARDLADAHQQGMMMLLSEGVREDSRDGPVLVMPCPVTTVYQNPTHRVLFSARRNCNPFFHLFEAFWMLAGKRDGRWLDPYIRNFSSRFGEDNGDIHGAYGHRWREHFGRPIFGEEATTLEIDQLDEAVRLLRESPGSRQVVISMWDPVIDLGTRARDRPCNTAIYLRVRGAVLDMTVLCRSNDAVMGAYGANAVHMSILQEYLAARIGVAVGVYYQVSNNFHAYERDLRIYDSIRWGSCEDDWRPYEDGVVVSHPLFDPDGLSTLDEEIRAWVAQPDGEMEHSGNSKLFEQLLVPMHRAHWQWREKRPQTALEELQLVAHSDWRTAAEQWIRRRMRP